MLFECRIVGVTGGNPDLYTDNPCGTGSMDAERMHRYSAATGSTNNKFVENSCVSQSCTGLFNLTDEQTNINFTENKILESFRFNQSSDRFACSFFCIRNCDKEICYRRQRNVCIIILLGNFDG